MNEEQMELEIPNITQEQMTQIQQFLNSDYFQELRQESYNNPSVVDEFLNEIQENYPD